MIEAIFYLLAITAAELITIYGDPIWGIVSHIAILIMVILQAAVDWRCPHRQLILSLALVPLVRIVSLSMPLVGIPQLWWYPIIYTPLLAAAIVVMRALGYGARDVGLNLNMLWAQLLIALTGIGLGVAEYLILQPEAMVAEFTWQAVWLPALLLSVCTGFVEEFIFRGVLQYAAVEAFGWWGVVYVSLLFAILHVGFLSWIDVAFVFAVALFFGRAVKKTGSLWGVVLSHGITNVVLYLIAPFLLN